MRSKIKLAKGDAIAVSGGWVRVNNLDGDVAELLIVPSDTSGATWTMRRGGPPGIFLMSAEPQVVIQMRFLPGRGIGKRGQFEVEAPDHVTLKIERKK
jgi:hypothetical protein